MAESIILQKSEDFALRIIKLGRYLESKQEFVLSRQILRSGTSIGANVAEGVHASTDKDFIYKHEIAQRESSETLYWLRLLFRGKYITKYQFDSLYNDVIEIEKILTAIIKKTKKKLK